MLRLFKTRITPTLGKQKKLLTIQQLSPNNDMEPKLVKVISNQNNLHEKEQELLMLHAKLKNNNYTALFSNKNLAGDKIEPFVIVAQKDINKLIK